MIQTMQANWLTVLIISFTIVVTPMYWFLVLPRNKAVTMSWITAVFAGVLLTCSLYNVVARLGYWGGPLIGALWIILPAIVWTKREWFKGGDQRILVGLQIFRVIGGLFLLEMTRGHIPASFALPAGIGDIIVGVLALGLVLNYREMPRWGVIAVLGIGVADFISAFFFGFTSLDGPAQLFAVGFDNNVNLFPTGLIPIFLVPYAISFHVLSWINFREKQSTP